MFTTISTNQLSAKISTKGAELVSLQSKISKTEYIWEGTPEIWGKHSPVLFPIVGSLKSNQYSYKDVLYDLPRHGFARDLEFEIINTAKSSVSFLLKSDSETFKSYPFLFKLIITYTLVESILNISYQVFNDNNFDMPFSIGGHPAFALTDHFENYSLYLENTKIINYHLLDDGLISNQTNELELADNFLKLSYEQYKNDALIIKNTTFKKIQINHLNKPLLAVCFDDFEHLGLWTKENAPFLCIEPWMGYSDTTSSSGFILNKEAIQILKPFTNNHYQFSIEIL